jgi:hypothetical protein
MISLLTFVQSGRLGAIELGSTREEVETVLGLPPAWDAESKIDNARIWKYGALEIYFQEHIVWMIFTDDFGTELNMGAIPFDHSGINGRMNEETLGKWLLAHGVEFKREVWSWCDEGVRLEATSGVTFTLCAEDEGKTALLCSFSVVRP